MQQHEQGPPCTTPFRSRASGARRDRLARLSALLAVAAAALALSARPAQAADVAVLSDEVMTQLPIWATNRTADIVLDFSKADPDFKLTGLGTINFRGKDMKVRGESSSSQAPFGRAAADVGLAAGTGVAVAAAQGGGQKPTSPHPFTPTPPKVKYHIGYYHGNVALVRFGHKIVAAVRKMHFYKTLRTDIEAYPLSTKPNEGEISWWGSKIAVCSMDAHTLQPVACQNFDPRTWKECLWNKGFEGTGERVCERLVSSVRLGRRFDTRS
jgi:hypothetical protein